tara:strand:+ start:143 stop:1918 length:1776 start_codon:yes stop_codon:yes gene_type:complete
MSVLQKLTEGIQTRNLQQEGDALLEKWERTGLLEGLDNENKRQGMARLLENQAAQLLKETSTMAGGDVEGFASVAFPIVRRVFGGLIANDLVSVQPMSLPSGLIFFLDFTTRFDKLGYGAGESLFGGGVVAQQITGGVILTGDNASKGPYNLNNGYAAATASSEENIRERAGALVGWGAVGRTDVAVGAGLQPTQAQLDEWVRFDPDLSGSSVAVISVTGSTGLAQFNTNDLVALCTTGTLDQGRLVRRLSQISTGSTGETPGNGNWEALLVFEATTANGLFGNNGGLLHELTGGTNVTGLGLGFPIDDNFVDGGALGSVVGATAWELENNGNLPEIDIKVDSVAVTAMTKKLKAKWTPELGQDLNAYHNLDAEVELTSILSEQIALEIDQEILEDLIKGAKAGTYYWSRSPGLFVRKDTGKEIGAASAAPDFTGTVSEWYETLLETVNDVSAQIHRKTLRGGANFLVTSPEVANIMEFTAGFRATVTADDKKGQAGTVKVGTLNNKWDVHVDPYFPRNVVLVGRRGSGFLESGYVYAPYVPLQVTPTIFGTEDFVPRKGVMTRYAKKMVRPDMYGLVIVRDLLGGAGATS